MKLKDKNMAHHLHKKQPYCFLVGQNKHHIQSNSSVQINPNPFSVITPLHEYNCQARG